MKKKKVISFVLAGALVMGAGQAWAATTHYNDSSVVRGTGEWSDWVQGWDEMAADFTQVSLTPGCAETELNFAWYSKGTNKSDVAMSFCEPRS